MTCARSEFVTTIEPRDVVIVEGILVFTNPELVNLMDIKIFVDTESDDRLMRCIRRDTKERGRTVNEVLHHYETSVKPMHHQFIEPTKRIADIIIPNGYNQVAIDLMVSKIKMQLNHHQ